MDKHTKVLLRGREFKKFFDCCYSEIRRKYDLKMSEAEVLYYLKYSGKDNTAKDIAESLHINKGHISSATDSLCRRGYLVSKRDESDYRVIHYSLTDEAEKIVSEISLSTSKMEEELFAGITQKQLSTLESVAERISQNISDIMKKEEQP